MPLAGGDRWKVQLGMSNDYTSRPNGDLEKMDTTYFTRFLLEWE